LSWTGRTESRASVRAEVLRLHTLGVQQERGLEGAPRPGTIHHEMGHTAGLFHEQQRCNRDLFVSVTGGGINCDRRCGGDSQDYVQYNYRSVMHYGYGHCCISQISLASYDHRGYPWEAGSASRLDTQDVQSINAMYYGHRAMPRLGAGIFYYLVPSHWRSTASPPATVAAWSSGTAGAGTTRSGSSLPRRATLAPPTSSTS
jgi:hypothetical protein